MRQTILLKFRFNSSLYIRVFHKNMFSKKKISGTHHALAWRLV